MSSSGDAGKLSKKDKMIVEDFSDPKGAKFEKKKNKMEKNLLGKKDKKEKVIKSQVKAKRKKQTRNKPLCFNTYQYLL